MFSQFCSECHKLKLTSLCLSGISLSRWVCLEALATKHEDSLQGQFSLCSVCHNLVIHCLPNLLAHILFSSCKTRTQHNYIRAGFSFQPMSREAKNQCLLILSAVTPLEQQLGVSFSTQTLMHGRAGSFVLLVVWSTDSLTPALCEAINGLYSWARDNTVIAACSQNQKKRRHCCRKKEMNESRWGWEERSRLGWQLKCCGHIWLEVCLRGVHNLTINCRFAGVPSTRHSRKKQGYLE